jgi:hypothetical protein
MLAASGKKNRHHALSGYKGAKETGQRVSLVFEFPVGDQSPIGPPDSWWNIDSRPLRPQSGGSFKKMVEELRILAGLDYAI